MTTPDIAENPAAVDTAPGTDTPARSVGYRAAHMRVQAGRGHASSYPCAGGCGRPAEDWSYDHLDPGELHALVEGRPRRYSASADHYRPLCRKCHRAFDYTHRVYETWNYPPPERDHTK